MGKQLSEVQRQLTQDLERKGMPREAAELLAERLPSTDDSSSKASSAPTGTQGAPDLNKSLLSGAGLKQDDPDIVAFRQHTYANLIENGILYNRPGGWVEIDMQQDEERIVVEVRDNGLGIRPEEQAKIFDRFYRGKSRADDQPDGRGLGLAITHHVVELHHGSVEMESTFGVGSTFRVTLKSEKSDMSY